MHKHFLVFTLLIIGELILSGQEFVVKDFQEHLTDISARENQVLDINNSPCALIKIYTGMKNLIFDGNRGIEKTEIMAGFVSLWIPEGTSQLKISREGMPMFVYTLPIDIKTSTVYSFKLESDRVFSVIINTGSVSADVWLGDSLYKSNTTIAGVPENNYTVRIQKLGYVTVTDTVTVNESNLYFAYTLQRTEQAVIKINSDPTGAVVLIDGELVGSTNFSGFRFPGQYRLQITLINYTAVDTTLIFDPSVKNTFDFLLTRNTGWLNPSVTPSDADISIDGFGIPRGITEVTAGSGHSISISKYRYRTINDPFAVKKGDTLNMTFSLQYQQGNMSFIVEPAEAEINIKKTLISLDIDKEFEDMTWTGNKQFSMPAGEYVLEAKRKGFLDIDTAFSITDEKTNYISLKMEPKKLSRAVAFLSSAVFPGLGQYYTQRNTAGTIFLTSELISLGATGYFFYLTEKLANDYNDIKSSYQSETNIQLIPDKRQAMDDAYLEYTDAVQKRDLCIGISAGIWILNIIDATVFAKMHKPVLQGNIGKNTIYNVQPNSGMNYLGASLNISF